MHVACSEPRLYRHIAAEESTVDSPVCLVFNGFLMNSVMPWSRAVPARPRSAPPPRQESGCCETAPKALGFSLGKLSRWSIWENRALGLWRVAYLQARQGLWWQCLQPQLERCFLLICHSMSTPLSGREQPQGAAALWWCTALVSQEKHEVRTWRQAAAAWGSLSVCSAPATHVSCITPSSGGVSNGNALIASLLRSLPVHGFCSLV